MLKKKKTDDKKKTDNGKTKSKDIKYLGGLLLSKMARGGAANLRSNADEVNKLNVFPVPDGDTGDNMRMTIESGIAAIENLDSDDLAEVMKVLSHGMLLGARGNSGVILSQFFAGIAKGFKANEKADPTVVANALQMGVKQAYGSVMTPTEGTILTVAREAVEYAAGRITPESTIRTLFADLVGEMHRSLDRTPEILTVLREAGVVDSGGAGLLYIMEGFNEVLNGKSVSGASKSVSGAKSPSAVSSFNENSEMVYGYCTELLVQLTRAKCDIDSFDVDALKDFLSGIGDSVVAFKADSIVKIHVHTFTPDKVMNYCLQFGEFLTVKVENMSVQHTELDEKAVQNKPKKNLPVKKYGIVAVSNGPGVDALFGELGCDAIVEGGQTQNPSTNDFLAAFEKVPAEHIFTFPNNGNILMAANQAAEIYKNAKIHVIPSKNIGTGYVAMSCVSFDGLEPDDIIKEMNEAMGRVTAGYVSPSIRDAEMNGVRIAKGDTIGVIEKQIVLSEKEMLTSATMLAEKIMEGDDKFMLTIFRGKDATEEDQAVLEENISKVCPDAEVYFIDGGQDIYPFIFVAE